MKSSKKNEKKPLEISSFYTSVPKITIICYTVPEIWFVTDVIVSFHFGLFFAQKKKNGSKGHQQSSTIKYCVGVQQSQSWGEGDSLALVGQPSSDGATIKMPYEVDVLHRPASHHIFSYWVG